MHRVNKFLIHLINNKIDLVVCHTVAPNQADVSNSFNGIFILVIFQLLLWTIRKITIESNEKLQVVIDIPLLYPSPWAFLRRPGNPPNPTPSIAREHEMENTRLWINKHTRFSTDPQTFL